MYTYTLHCSVVLQPFSLFEEPNRRAKCNRAERGRDSNNAEGDEWNRVGGWMGRERGLGQCHTISLITILGRGYKGNDL